MDEFQEFPKCLYLGGDLEAAYVVVADAEAEAFQREQGYAVIGESVQKEDAPRKPGRPRKAE